MRKKMSRIFNAITFLCISLICVIGLGFGLRASGVTGENFVTRLLSFGGNTSDDPYEKGPIRSKTISANGDGSYKLALSVTGESELEENYSKANVIVVLDISGSMNFPADETGVKKVGKKDIGYYVKDDDGDYWRLYYRVNEGTYGNPKYVYYEEGTEGPEKNQRHDNVYITYTIDTNGTINYQSASGDRYIFDNNATRLEETKLSVKNAISTLLSQNSSVHPDMVEVSFMTFSSYSNYVKPNTASATGWVSGTDTSSLDTIIDNISAGGGTNWDAALYNAKLLADKKKAVDKNDDTYIIFFSDGEPTAYTGSIDWSGKHTHGNSNARYPSVEDSNKAAVAEAISLYNAKYKMFGIFAYGNSTGEKYMNNLVSNAIYGNDSKKDDVAGEYSFGASSKDDMDKAFKKITSYISATVGISDVSINDGTTSRVQTKTDIVSLLTVDKDSFKYYKNDTEWAEAPKAELKDGQVIWDLGDGLLDNGVTYKVTFDVWPSQYTLDLIANLKNGVVKYNDLDPAIQEYLSENYELATNTEATIEYTDTRTTDGKQTGKFVNPERVATKSYVLNVEKKWKNELDTRLIPNQGIALVVYKDGEALDKGVAVSQATDWKNSTNIAVGMIRVDNKTKAVKILEKGHEYSLGEPEGLTYHWELDSLVVRPVLINNVMTVLVKDANTELDADYKKIGDKEYYRIDGKAYYIDNELTELIATNYRRSYLDLTKKVTGENAEKDAKFTYKVKVTNSKASEDTSGNDSNIWFSVYKDANDKNSVVTNLNTSATSNGDGSYYIASGTEFDVEIQAGWNLRVFNLPTGSSYEIEETTMPSGFVFKSVTGEGTIEGRKIKGNIAEYNTAYNVAYTNEYVLTDVTVTKVWDDDSNRDGVRPESIEVGVYDGTKLVKSATLTGEEDTWTHTFTKLNKYDGERTIAYSVKEIKTTEDNGIQVVNAIGDDYTVEVDGLTITNKHTTKVSDVTVTKVWDDGNNQDGKRLTSVSLQLYANGKEYGDPVTVTAGEAGGNRWTYTYKNLYVNENGNPIEYTVKELNDLPEDYTKEEKGLVVTNKYTPKTIELSVKKVWDDNDNQDGKRPASVTAVLSNGTKVVLNEGNEWTATVKDLAKYNNGVEVQYTWSEETIGNDYELVGNEVSKDDSTLTILTNKRKLETTQATVKKVWNDDSNRDGLRPSSLNVYLNGTKYVLDEENKWSVTVTDLPRNKEGKPITYTWTEDDVSGYTSSSLIEGTITTLTNSHQIATKDVTVTKVWDDKNNQDRVRPNSVLLQLYANGTPVEEPVNLSAPETGGNTWTYTYSKLPVKANGVAIEYTVKEVKVLDSGKIEEVTSVGDYKVSASGLTVTNTRDVDTVDVKVQKNWIDKNNQDRVRPDKLVIKLMNGDTVVKTHELTGTGNIWEYTFEDVDKNQNGREINYTVVEELENGSSYKELPVVGDYKSVIQLSNKYVPETVKIAGEKHWVDGNNQDGVRPQSVTVKLMEVTYDEDGKEIKNPVMKDGTIVTAFASKETEWKYSFTVDKNRDGKAIIYAVEELPVDGYETTYAETGYDITNTHKLATIDVEGTKTWVDGDNQDGLRQTSATVRLVEISKDAEGKIVKTPVKDENNEDVVAVASEETEWKYSFGDLPANRDGQPIAYGVEEVDVPTGYTPTYDGYNVTNTHTPEVVTIRTEKVWEDDSNNDRVRPTEITIRLLAGGTEIDHQVVKATDNWSAVFEDLPVYSNGNRIKYTITEDEVEGYTTKVEGYKVINTHANKETSFDVSKVWDDSDNQDGKRPESVTVNLLKEGTKVDSVVLNEENGWKHTFTGLQQLKDGKDIVYTVVEEDTKVEGYSATYNGGVVTNHYDPEKTTFTVIKAWDDSDNQDGVRPESIKVQLYADGKESGEPVEITKEDGWTYTYKDLDVYSEGKVIEYTVKEIDVDENYEASLKEKEVVEETTEEVQGEAIIGATIVNKHTPETTEVLGTVYWDDEEDKDELRPEEVTICVYANGEKKDCTTVKEEDGTWTYEFDELPKYEDGQEIKYTVSEDDIDEYEINPNGYDFTNKHVPEDGEVLGESEEFNNDKKDNDNPETGDTILPFALLFLTSLGGISITAKKIVDREK